MLDGSIMPLFAAGFGAIVGGAIGMFSSTFAASFNNDRLRQIRVIGIARALLADAERIRTALDFDPACPWTWLGPPRRDVPSISPWVGPLVPEIALASAEIVEKLLRLQSQLGQLTSLIALIEPARSAAVGAMKERLIATSHSTPGFTADGQIVWPDHVQAAIDSYETAETFASGLESALALTHRETLTTLATLVLMLATFATASMPPRSILPEPEDLVADS
jgi:hypothetical protein